MIGAESLTAGGGLLTVFISIVSLLYRSYSKRLNDLSHEIARIDRRLNDVEDKFEERLGNIEKQISKLAQRVSKNEEAITWIKSQIQSSSSNPGREEWSSSEEKNE